jgi:hypothetical protein
MDASWSRTERIGRWLTGTLIAVSGVYLLDVLIQFNQLIASTYLDADAASAPVIGELYGGSPAHREVVLGQMAWFSTLMFELATRWLPLHRQIWELAPYAMALASVGLVGWGAWRVAGRWAATITAAILLCAAPHMLHLLFSLNDHSPTWFSLALLAGLLVLVESRGARLKPLAAVLAIVIVGVVVGANAASDTLLIGAGVAPVLLAAVGAWVLRPGADSARAAWLIAATLATAAVCDVLTRALMRHENVTIPAEVSHTGLATGAAVVSNFELWWQSIAVLGNGDFFGASLGLTAGLELACAFLAVLAVVLAPRIAWHELQRAVRAYRRTQTDSADKTASSVSTDQTTRIAWCLFWGSSAVLLSVGFIVSSTPVDINSDRYLVGVIYAAGALLPLLATGSAMRRVAVTTGAGVFALTGLIALAQGQVTANTGNFPTDSVSGQVADVARREHLSIGYAGYWDAAPITWASRFRVKVYPVQVCPGDAQLCKFGIHYISSWYTPRPHERTFLISDPTQPIAAPAVPSLGPPSAVYHIAELTMYVYPYDIASRLQP